MAVLSIAALLFNGKFQRLPLPAFALITAGLAYGHMDFQMTRK
jgi:hypothetical protein